MLASGQSLPLRATPLACELRSACEPDHVDTPRAQVLATANVVLNLVKAHGTVRAESVRLPRAAYGQRFQALPPLEGCSATCRASSAGRVRLNAVPNKFLTSDPDVARYAKQLLSTSEQPLIFGPHEARSVDELSAWLFEVLKGEGKDGIELYRKCDGTCSPRYSMELREDAGGFAATLSVVCGHARDRADNSYTISSAYRFACESKQQRP